MYIRRVQIWPYATYNNNRVSLRDTILAWNEPRGIVCEWCNPLQSVAGLCEYKSPDTHIYRYLYGSINIIIILLCGIHYLSTYAVEYNN